MPRYLALDVGDRRIGLATGSTETGLARPLETLVRSDDPRDADIFRRLKQVIRAEQIEGLVVGDPLNMDGTAGLRSDISHDFAGRLRKAFRQIPVTLCDERLSSFAADEWMQRDGVKPSHKKQKRDAYAAAVILADFLRSQEAE